MIRNHLSVACKSISSFTSARSCETGAKHGSEKIHTLSDVGSQWLFACQSPFVDIAMLFLLFAFFGLARLLSYSGELYCPVDPLNTNDTNACQGAVKYSFTIQLGVCMKMAPVGCGNYSFNNTDFYAIFTTVNPAPDPSLQVATYDGMLPLFFSSLIRRCAMPE
jgi:hypothetical protein